MHLHLTLFVLVHFVKHTTFIIFSESHSLLCLDRARSIPIAMAAPPQVAQGQAANTAPRQNPRPDLTAILGNLGSLLKMDQEGKLSLLQVNQVSMQHQQPQ